MPSTPPSAGVVVGVDGTPTASRAVRWAVEDALRRGAVLRLVTAYRADALESDRPAPTGGERLRPGSRSVGRGFLEEAVDLARRLVPCLPVETALVPGGAPQVLLEQSTDGLTLVVGSRGLGPIRRLTKASVSAEVMAKASCPVVVVREAASRTLTDPRIVVGVDGKGSLGAVAYAFDQAVRQHCGLTVVHVWQRSWSRRGAATDPRSGRPDPADRAQDELTSLLAPFRSLSADVDVRYLVVEGDAAERLAALSRNARLLAVGSRGRDAVTALLLGSVSLAVARTARCPLAVVHAYPEAGPMGRRGETRSHQHPHPSTTTGSPP